MCRSWDASRHGIATIHQELSLVGSMTVAENMALPRAGAMLGWVRGADDVREARRVLAAMDLDVDPAALVETLPLATQQLVEIARALAIGCRVLVLDEPTSSLGHADVHALFALIARLKAQGIAIVYISHFIEEVKAVSDRVVVLRDGKNAGGGMTADMPAEAIVGLMVGRTLGELYPHGVRAAGEPVLELDGLVPGAATLTLRRGEILGIAGLLGAGRTRLLRAIFGLEPVRDGRVSVGAYSGWSGPHDRWRQGMGMLSEDRAGEGLAMGLSVADNMTLTRLEPFGPAFTVWPGRQDCAAARWIDRLGIRCSHPRQPIGQLSGGNQQKVAVGRLLHHDVDVLVLDEPTRGIDVASKAQIYQLIDELVSGGPERAAPQGVSAPPGVARPFQGREKAVLLVSSYLPELLGVCDRIAVMSRGRLGPAQPVEAWTEHSLLMEASGARAS